MTEKKFEEAMERLRRERDVLMRLKNADLIKHVSSVAHLGTMTVFCEGGDIEKRRAEFVREFGNDHLSTYYLGYSGRNLMVLYRHPQAEIEVAYSDPNREERLRQLSGGKCHITREAVESVAEQIICAMPED